MFKTKQLHTAIDIGNAKISGVCASVDGEEIVIKGVAEAPALGIKKSCVINLDMAAQQVKKVIKVKVKKTTGGLLHFPLCFIDLYRFIKKIFYFFYRLRSREPCCFSSRFYAKAVSPAH